METVRTVLKSKQALPEVKPKQVTPQIKFTQKQNYLYLKAILGVKGISQELQQHLSEEQKFEIDKEARKVQKFLNVWKQELCIERTNNLFKRFFPNTLFTKTLTDKFSNPDPKFFNTLNWKELGISKPVIAQKLIENGYLPQNFYQL
jgi:hypothetical protein